MAVQHSVFVPIYEVGEHAAGHLAIGVGKPALEVGARRLLLTFAEHAKTPCCRRGAERNAYKRLTRA